MEKVGWSACKEPANYHSTTQEGSVKHEPIPGGSKRVTLEQRPSPNDNVLLPVSDQVAFCILRTPQSHRIPIQNRGAVFLNTDFFRI